MAILKNIDIVILEHIDIVKISNRFEFGISNRALWGGCKHGKHLEEEGVILEPGVGRLHRGEHPRHGHACRALDVIVERAEPAQQCEI